MAAQGRQTIAITDHTKIGQVTRVRVCPLDNVDLLITDSGVSDTDKALFAGTGLEVRRV